MRGALFLTGMLTAMISVVFGFMLLASYLMERIFVGVW